MKRETKWIWRPKKAILLLHLQPFLRVIWVLSTAPIPKMCHCLIARRGTLRILISMEDTEDIKRNRKLHKEALFADVLVYQLYTLVDVSDVSPLFALFPRSIFTEMLACDKSTPAFCSACVRLLNNLFVHNSIFAVSLLSSNQSLQSPAKKKKQSQQRLPWFQYIDKMVLPTKETQNINEKIPTI